MKVIFYLLTFLFINCESSNTTTEGEYQGYWARTTWVWTFTKNNKFKFTSKGELGDKETQGNFSRIHDTLFIHFLSGDIRPSGYRADENDTLLISSEHCLVSINDGYDYCKQQGNSPNEFHISKHRKINRN